MISAAGTTPATPQASVGAPGSAGDPEAAAAFTAELSLLGVFAAPAAGVPTPVTAPVAGDGTETPETPQPETASEDEAASADVAPMGSAVLVAMASAGRLPLAVVAAPDSPAAPVPGPNAPGAAPVEAGVRVPQPVTGPAGDTGPGTTTIAAPAVTSGDDPLPPSAPAGTPSSVEPEPAAPKVATATLTVVAVPSETAAPTAAPATVTVPDGGAPLDLSAMRDRASLAAALSTRVHAVHRGGDGLYSMTVHAHPADLGPVTIAVRVQDGLVDVSLAAVHEQARAALAEAGPSIRRELAVAGLVCDRVSVTSDAGSSPQNFPSAGHDARLADSGPGHGSKHDRRAQPWTDTGETHEKQPVALVQTESASTGVDVRA